MEQIITDIIDRYNKLNSRDPRNTTDERKFLQSLISQYAPAKTKKLEQVKEILEEEILK